MNIQLKKCIRLDRLLKCKAINKDKLNQNLTEMELLVNEAYQRSITSKFEPAIIKL